MTLPDQVVSWIAVGAAGGAALLAVVIVVLAARLARLRRAYASALDPSRREDLFESVQRQAAELEEVRDDLRVVHGNTEHLRELLSSTISKVGMVRYDAFEDMGGALSFSAALLDEHADGVVISAINGRSETRCYAKPIRGGASEHNLSAEERGAIEAALTRAKGDAPDVGGRRRRRAS